MVPANTSLWQTAKEGFQVIGVNPQTGALSDLHCIDHEAPGNLPCYPLVTNTHGIPQFVAAQQETIYVGNVGSDDISVFLQAPNGDLGTSIPSEFMSGTHDLNFLDFAGGKLFAAGDSGIAQMKAPRGAITLAVNFVLDSSVGYRAATIHDSGNFLYAIDENDSIHVCLFTCSAPWGKRIRSLSRVRMEPRPSPSWRILPMSHTRTREMFLFTRSTQVHARATPVPLAAHLRL